MPVLKTTCERYREYWVKSPTSHSALVVFRVVFGLVFAIDAWLQISHAPRYGAGGFNVPHILSLESLFGLPSRQGMLIVYILQAYLGFLLALGRLPRLAYMGLLALFAYGYFVSQLNSYQHHYFIFLILAIGLFLPWQGSEKKRHWPARLLFVQIAWVYIFAGIAKLDPNWLNGSALAIQIGQSPLKPIADALGIHRVALLVCITEFLLALCWLAPKKLWPIALIIGIPFHLSIEISQFRIGLFTYFMLALYLLMLPASLLNWTHAFRWNCFFSESIRHRWVAVLLILISGCIALNAVLPFDHALALSLGITVIGALTFRTSQLFSSAMAHGLSIAFLFILISTTAAARDYHRFWGGSARRLGNLDEATLAYQKVTEIDPTYPQGHTSLGNLHRRQKRNGLAIQSYESALSLASADWRPHQGLAQIFEQEQNHEKALWHAKQAVQLAPQKAKVAQTILRRLEP